MTIPAIVVTDAHRVIEAIAEIRDVMKRTKLLACSTPWSGDRYDLRGDKAPDPRLLLLTSLDEVEREALAWIGHHTAHPELHETTPGGDA